MTTRRGQVFRAPSGEWAIRHYEANGRRRQRNGFRTRGEATEALNESLRRVRLGPLYRPEMPLRALVDAYWSSTTRRRRPVTWLRYNLGTALETLGDERIGELTAQQVGAWRASLKESRRHPAHRALRQVLEAAMRWKGIEENVAALVKNSAPKLGEIDPFERWEEIEAIAAELDKVQAVLVEVLVGTGVRPEEAFGGSGAMSTSSAGS